MRIPPESGGFPHSEIPGSKPVSRLPEAYRKLQRPSSPLAAKASTERTSMLDHIIQRISRPATRSRADRAGFWQRILPAQRTRRSVKKQELARRTKTHTHRPPKWASGYPRCYCIE